MPRMSIQQFRAALASRSEQGVVLPRAYREITLRPRAAGRMATIGWIPWGIAAPATAA